MCKWLQLTLSGTEKTAAHRTSGSIIRKAKSGPAKPKRSPLFPQRRSVVEMHSIALKNRLSLRGRKLEAFKLKNILGEVTQTKLVLPAEMLSDLPRYA